MADCTPGWSGITSAVLDPLRAAVMHRASILAAAVLASTPALAQQVSLSKAVRSGASTRLGFERAWDHACAAVASHVSITQQPEHGTVSIVRTSSLIPASTPRSGSIGPCAGRSVVGSEIVYRSQPGFHGQDRVSWSAAYGNGGGGTTDVDIIVR